ncbi:hypothetical protein FN846DRAFT_584559 [Sphaerosporella brunnea]|uniref:Uncharacterized protein n=1 Tax=Sphaerosporella brunnea TaxID=1250544 RepID=A0A5J5F233_9PEZI|nr:hypothetical protein FN846DRAFT_584559 [Sphaerosporella brunnea]
MPEFLLCGVFIIPPPALVRRDSKHPLVWMTWLSDPQTQRARILACAASRMAANTTTARPCFPALGSLAAVRPHVLYRNLTGQMPSPPSACQPKCGNTKGQKALAARYRGLRTHASSMGQYIGLRSRKQDRTTSDLTPHKHGIAGGLSQTLLGENPLLRPSSISRCLCFAAISSRPTLLITSLSRGQIPFGPNNVPGPTTSRQTAPHIHNHCTDRQPHLHIVYRSSCMHRVIAGQVCRIIDFACASQK